jgi:N-acetyltransferase
MAARTPGPVTLTGRHIRLEPLTHEHLPDLYAAGGRDEEVWRYLTAPTPQNEQEFAAVLGARIAESAAGDRVAFAVVDLGSGRAIGTTNLHDWNERNECVEIGGTWYARSAWRTAVNTEAKLLLLTHAFEDLGMGRLVWQTDNLNTRSQDAIARLGARREGVHRRAKRRPDGTWRDSVLYSLLVDEWPDAKARLTDRLAKG